MRVDVRCHKSQCCSSWQQNGLGDYAADVLVSIARELVWWIAQIKTGAKVCEADAAHCAMQSQRQDMIASWKCAQESATGAMREKYLGKKSGVHMHRNRPSAAAVQLSLLFSRYRSRILNELRHYIPEPLDGWRLRSSAAPTCTSHIRPDTLNTRVATPCALELPHIPTGSRFTETEFGDLLPEQQQLVF